MAEKSKQIFRWILGVWLCLLPAGVFIHGTVKLFFGTVINSSFVLRCWVLPIVTIGVVVLLLRSKVLVLAKTIWAVLIALLFLAVSFFLILGGVHTEKHRYRGEDALETYNESFAVTEEVFPVAEELGTVEKAEYYEIHTDIAIFSSDTQALICQYGEEEYAKQAAAAAEAFVFQQETVVLNDSSCEPSAEIKGYTFYLLSVEKDVYEWAEYPKRLLLFGRNDKTRELVYMQFYDADLDYIVSLKDFIKRDCGWKYIR